MRTQLIQIRVLTGLALLLCLASDLQAGWVELSNVKIEQEEAELAGQCVVIEYDLTGDVSVDRPVYVFVRYSRNGGKDWLLLEPEMLRENGFGIVAKPGHKRIVWWGVTETGAPGLEQIQFHVWGIRMSRIPTGTFVMKSLPGQGRDETQSREPSKMLPQFYMAQSEVTISMYLDYLAEVGADGTGWNAKMSNPDRCGIERQEDGTFKALPGREEYPVSYVSWYDSVAFLKWCGLRLPSEAEFEKAIRGGHFLDGDEVGKVKNPNPERRFPWGNEMPDEGGVFRCNFEGAQDGFEYSAPVGSFSKFNSPYGIADLVGNLAEWTLDWYTTSHHAGLDGFRLVRGGSWMAYPDAVDAITGATQFPIKETSIQGFRGVKD